MGRPPKPAEQKRLLGNPGKRPLPEPLATLPPAPVQIPDPPRGLGRQGKEVWIRLWTAAHGWLSPKTDLGILTRLCQLHDERAELLKVVRIRHMAKDLEVLAEVLDERADMEALQAALANVLAGEIGATDQVAILRVLFRRVRALEEQVQTGAPGAEGPRAENSQGKRRPGSVPVTGYFGLGSKGQLVLHPAVKALRVVDAEIRRLEALCGFNPSDRTHLGFAEVKRQSKLEELLERRRQRQDDGEEAAD